MATKLEKFDFRFRPGKKSKYPWDEWLDGSIYQLKAGEDFDSSAKNFTSTVFNAARTRGLKVQSRVEGDVVTIRAYKPPKRK